MSASASPQTICDLLLGQASEVVDVCGERMQRMKLLDLGLTPGTEVTVQKIAPMGDPIEISLRSYVLTLRKEEASLVQVAPACGKSGEAAHV